jgi:uncharacterized lipoprotein
MIRRFFYVTGMFCAISLTGCALTPDVVKVDYTPQANVAKKPGAELVAVKVDLIDSRKIKDKVSVKKNGYGMEMAAITSEADVPTLIKNSINTELKARGFLLGEGKASSIIDVTKFYSDFKVGFFAGEAVGELNMTVQIKKSDGSILYSRNIAAEGIAKDVMMMGGENARIALTAALQNAMVALFDDAAFTDTLIKAGK